MLTPAELPGCFPQLRRISDAWLAEKNTREKGFSLGSFDERYLANFPLALVRQKENIIAFALMCRLADRSNHGINKKD